MSKVSWRGRSYDGRCYSSGFRYMESKVLPSLSFQVIQPLLLLPMQKSAAVLGLLNVMSVLSLSFSFLRWVYSFSILSRFSFQEKEGTDVATTVLPFSSVNPLLDRKSTRLNSSHANISYAVFCL